jgi:quercetin dioxygenase-like cupin family protein
VQQWDLRQLDVQPHHPQVLQSEPEGRTILLLLPRDESLQEHQVHERAWVLVVDGEVEMDRDGEAVRAGPGHLFVFEPNEPHEVRGRSDARLLLVLAPWPGEGHPRRGAG